MKVSAPRDSAREHLQPALLAMAEPLPEEKAFVWSSKPFNFQGSTLNPEAYTLRLQHRLGFTLQLVLQMNHAVTVTGSCPRRVKVSGTWAKSLQCPGCAADRYSRIQPAHGHIPLELALRCEHSSWGGGRARFTPAGTPLSAIGERRKKRGQLSPEAIVNLFLPHLRVCDSLSLLEQELLGLQLRDELLELQAQWCALLASGLEP